MKSGRAGLWGVAALGLLTACSPLASDVTVPTSSSTASAPGPMPCPKGSPLPRGQHVVIDYVDYVMVNGVRYLSNFGRGPQPDGPPWQLVARVRCNPRDLPDNRLPPGPSDGSAAFLPVGTALYATRGLPVSCELQARVDGQWRAYIATYDRGGKATLSPCWRHPDPAP